MDMVHLSFAKLPSSFDGHILPNLDKLIWMFVSNIPSFPQVLVFLTPKLKTILLHAHCSTGGPGPAPDIGPLERTVSSIRRAGDVAPEHLTLLVSGDPNYTWESEEATRWIQANSNLISLSLNGVLTTAPLSNILMNHTQLRELSATLNYTFEEVFTQNMIALAQTCPQLTSLSLTLAATWPEATIPFDTISPLTQLPHLTSLQLEGRTPMTLTAEDVQTMAAAWRQMTSLGICSEVSDVTEGGTPLWLLPEFSQGFGPLVHLRHWFNVDESMPRPVSSGKQFSGRLVLEVGTSWMAENHVPEVRSFLKEVCPFGVLVAADEGAQHGGWRLLDGLIT